MISPTFPTAVLNPSMPSSKADTSMRDLKRENTESSGKEERRNTSSTREKHKRPDKQLYVPRALRGQSRCLPIQEKCEKFDESLTDLCSQSSETASDVKCDKQPAVQSKDIESEENVSFPISSVPPKKDNEAVSCLEIKTISLQTNHLLDISQVFVLNQPVSCQSSTEVNQIVEDAEISFEVNTAMEHEYQNSVIEAEINSTNVDCKSKNVEEIALSKCDKSSTEASDLVKPCIKDEEHGDSWEAMFDDDGECLNPDVVKELSNAVGRIKIHVTKNSYSEYQPSSETLSGECDNIVELYNFPKEFSTQDLVSALSCFQQACYTIKWVDDSHALALFSSPALVNQALQLNHPFVKVRPLSEGIKESKVKAKCFSGNCEPSKPRPATSAVLARRLVSGALGLKVQTTKEQREMERTLLKEAKEKRKLKAKQRQDIWDGVVL